jgi:hypothetical protein
VRVLCRAGMRCPGHSCDQQGTLWWFCAHDPMTERAKGLARLMMDAGLVFSRTRVDAAVHPRPHHQCQNCAVYIAWWERRELTHRAVLAVLWRRGPIRRRLGRDATGLVAQALWNLRFAVD